MVIRAVRSIINQSHTVDEIIIVDDGSTDHTKHLITENFPMVHYIKQNHAGVSMARNTGILNATHKRIAFLDSDDEWLPEKIKQQMLAMDQNPSYKICHTNELWLKNSQPLKQLKKHQKYGGWIFQHCLARCIISPSSVMIQRSLLDEVGLFDADLPACEDYDMWLRICAKYPVLFLTTPLIIKHGGHSDQLSQKHWGMDRFRIMALHKIIQNNNLNHSNCQIAITTLIDKLRLFLKGAKKHHNQLALDQFIPILKLYEKS